MKSAIILLFYVPLYLAAQTSITSTQCATIGIGPKVAQVAIAVTGTWSGTLQPQVSLQGQAPANTQVTPSTSSTAQSTITANGAYFTIGIAGADTFLLCGNTVASGKANIYLNISTAGSVSKGGGSSGGGSPGAPDTSLQFRTNSTTFGGDANLEWNNTSKILSFGTAASTLWPIPTSGMLSHTSTTPGPMDFYQNISNYANPYDVTNYDTVYQWGYNLAPGGSQINPSWPAVGYGMENYFTPTPSVVQSELHTYYVADARLANGTPGTQYRPTSLILNYADSKNWNYFLHLGQITYFDGINNSSYGFIGPAGIQFMTYPANTDISTPTDGWTIVGAGGGNPGVQFNTVGATPNKDLLFGGWRNINLGSQASVSTATGQITTHGTSTGSLNISPTAIIGYSDNAFSTVTSRINNNTGTYVTYGGQTVVGNGLPGEIVLVNLVAQSAAITATNLTASAPQTGMYRISWTADITTADGTSSTLGGTNGFQIGYTSPTDSVAKLTVPDASVSSSANTTATSVGSSILVYAKTGTAITYSIGYTSNTPGQMVYELHVRLEEM